MPGVLLCCSACQAYRGAPLAGVLLCRLAHQALKGLLWVGSCSIGQCVRHLMGQPLYGPASNAGMWGKRGYGDGSTPTCDSAVSPCFHRCPAFLHRHFPPQSPPSYPLSPSLRSQQQPSPWDCSTIPKLQSLSLPGDPSSCPAYVWLQQELSDSHSICAAIDQLFHSQP